MPAYFTSDVHLRLDHPERGRRFGAWVDTLEPDDSLTIVGDLCDFWLASRQYPAAFSTCAGLTALAGFRRRGGALTILPGNHDAWLGPAYERELGARIIHEPFETSAFGLRLFLLHGHKVGGHPAWKGGMETRAFLTAFRLAPGPLATLLGDVLDRRNYRSRELDDARQLAAYRAFVASQAGAADLFIIGHVHRPLDDAASSPRLIVPGGWFGRASYVKVDASGAALFVESDPAPIAC